MSNQPSHGVHRGSLGRAAGTFSGIRAFAAAGAATIKARTAAATATVVLAAGATMGAAAGDSRAEAFVNPTGTQHAIVDEALRNAVVPPELALAVARVPPDDGDAAGHVRHGPRSVRRGVVRLERLYRRYDERWDLALSHYFGGPLARCKGRYVSHVHTHSRVASVMEWWRRYQEDRTLSDLVRRTRAIRARGARLAATDTGTTPGVKYEEYDKRRSRPEGRSRPNRGDHVALPFVQGRFRSDDHPTYGAVRPGRSARFR